MLTGKKSISARIIGSSKVHIRDHDVGRVFGNIEKKERQK